MSVAGTTLLGSVACSYEETAHAITMHCVCCRDHATGFRRVFIRGDSACHSGEGDVTACSVEELALGHYKTLGYTEGQWQAILSVQCHSYLCTWSQHLLLALSIVAAQGGADAHS